MVEIKDSAFMSDLSAVAGKIDFTPLNGLNVLVTGATGMIGNTVVRMLLANPNVDLNVYAAGRSVSRLNTVYSTYLGDARLHIIEMDVTKPICHDIDFHYVVDCASLGNPASFKEKPVDVILANVVGVDNLLSYGFRHGLKKMIYVSSGEVYGEGDGREFCEDYCGYIDISDVRSCYPQSKRAAEVLCLSYASQYGMDVSIARPCHIYGPNFSETDDRAFAQFMRNAVLGENIVLKSPGSQIRSWLYVVDCAAALIHIMMNGECGEAYNIAPYGESASIREFASLVAAANGCEIVFDIPDGVDRNAIITKGVLDASKINRLGWRNNYSICNGIERCLKELKNNLNV